MTLPRDPDAIDPTIVPLGADHDVTIVPAGGGFPTAPDAAATDPARGSAPTDPVGSGGAAATELDATRAAPALPFQSATDADADATRTAAAGAAGPYSPPPAPGGDRYLIRGFHAKGGLGEVFRARDTELDREVAFKRMQVGYADDPGWREKFVAEARVTARLDHPGVVPVFGLVADSYGRPCYAMRFIAGATLREEIDRFHGRPAADGSPPAPPADDEARRHGLRQLLQRFVAVCQAVGFAHTRGVVHRDLKPANVMVGTFGETLVVDWGLAKVVGDGATPEAPAADAGDDPDATDPDQRTAAGRAVGTPAFMPPEQAVGAADAGPAADIFGLGAILFYTLTGRPPYSGGNATNTIALARAGDYPLPSAVAEGVPPALEAVCLRALAPAPADRYPTALDLAADVERWLADEPVAAYPEPWSARAQRWVRRNPARVAAAVSGLLAGLVAAVAIVVVVNAARSQTAAANKGLEIARADTAKALDDEKAARKQTDAALAEVRLEKERTEQQRAAAVAAEQTAEERFGLAQKAFGTLVGNVQDRLDDRAGTQKLREAVLAEALAGLDQLCATADGRADHAGAQQLRAWARLQMGDVKRALGKSREAVADYAAAAAAAAEAEVLGKPSADRAGRADALDRLADAYLALGEVPKAVGVAKEAEGLRRGRKDTGPGQLAGTLDRVAAAWLALGDTTRAKAASDEALTLHQNSMRHSGDPVGVSGPLAVAAAHDRDAEIKLRLGDTPAAAAAADAALLVAKQAGIDSPDLVGPQRTVAAAFGRIAEVAAERGDFAGVVTAREAADQLLTGLSTKDALNVAVRAEAAVARGRLGVARLRQGNPTAAASETAVARARADELAKLDPESAWSARAVGHTAWDRGEVLLAAGGKDAALAEFRTAVDRFEKIARDQPDSAAAARDAAEARERLAAATAATAATPQEKAGAIKLLEASVAERTKLAGKDTGNARALGDVAAAYGRLGEALLAAERYSAAEAAAAAAVAGFRKRAEADPANLAALRDLSAARTAWGRVTGTRGEATLTLILLGQAQDGFDRIAAADRSNPVAAAERATALTRLADALAEADHPEARKRLEDEALALRVAEAKARPDDPAAARALAESERRLAELAVAGTRPDRHEAAAGLYAAADAALAKFPGNPVVAGEAAAVAAGKEVLAGIKAAGASRTAVERIESPEVRARVLLVVAEDALRASPPQPVTAVWAATTLAEQPRGPADVYRAAVVVARVAEKEKAPARHAPEALALLERAVERGFRNPDLLRARWWDGLRDDPRFRAAAAKLAATQE